MVAGNQYDFAAGSNIGTEEEFEDYHIPVEEAWTVFEELLSFY